MISLFSYNALVVVYAASNSKKKNKKNVKATAAPMSSSSLSVESGFLCLSYQEIMVAGLAMLETSPDKSELMPAYSTLMVMTDLAS